MRLIDSIRAAWCDRGQFQKRCGSLTLDEAGLMLGAGTILAKRVNGTLDIDGDEDRARIFALLTKAYGPAIRASVLGHIERAAKAEKSTECGFPPENCGTRIDSPEAGQWIWG